MYYISDQASKASTKLKGCPLTAGRTACNVGQYGRNKDQWSCSRCNMLIGRNRLNDHISAPVSLFVKGMVKPYNENTRNRKKIKHPWMGQTIVCGKTDSHGKQASNQSSYTSDQKCDQTPFCKIAQISS